MATSATNTAAMATSAMATSASNTKKWETGIDATATDIKEIKAFVDWRLSIYKENGWKGFDLWESFINNFESFTRDILDNLGKDRLKKIRDYLRKNSVYVRKEARKLIVDGHVYIAKRALQHPCILATPTLLIFTKLSLTCLLSILVLFKS